MQDNLKLPTMIDPARDVRSPQSQTSGGHQPGQSFDDALSTALRGVEDLQTESDRQAAMQALGAGNLHENAIALEKADISMRLLVKTRTKVVDAYQEVMRMSI